jgi:hypothetical protein
MLWMVTMFYHYITHSYLSLTRKVFWSCSWKMFFAKKKANNDGLHRILNLETYHMCCLFFYKLKAFGFRSRITPHPLHYKGSYGPTILFHKIQDPKPWPSISVWSACHEDMRLIDVDLKLVAIWVGGLMGLVAFFYFNGDVRTYLQRNW